MPFLVWHNEAAALANLIDAWKEYPFVNPTAKAAIIVVLYD